MVDGTPALTWNVEVLEDTNGDGLRDPGDVSLATASHTAAACPFDAAGDADGDGVPDGIDSDAGTGIHPAGMFSDDTGDYRKSTGFVVDAAGLDLSFADAPDPRGVRITAGAGTGGPAVLSVCSGTAELELPAGASVVVTCGSVSVSEVRDGTVTLRLPGHVTTLAVPSGSEATVDATPEGEFEVTGVTGTVELAVDGVARTLTTGQTVTGASWDFAGFSAPVDNGGVLNVVKAGQTVPLKWRLLRADGSPMTTLASVQVTAASLACVAGAPADDLEVTAADASGLKNLGDGYYQFNWATPKSYANSCRTLRLDVGDGVVHEALFRFKR